MTEETTPIFTRVRESCAKVAQNAEFVSINETKLAEFANTLTPEKIAAKISEFEQPENSYIAQIEHKNDHDRRAFLLLYGCMQLGHGFRYALKKTLGTGASQTITNGMVKMYGKLSAPELSALTRKQVQEYFGITNAIIEQERCLLTLVMQIQTVLVEIGVTLEHKKCNDLEEWRQKHVPQPDNAECLVTALFDTFPNMRDQYQFFNGTNVVYAKKAVLAALLIDLDMTQATGIVDNVVPAVLTHVEILELVPAFRKKISNKEIIPRGPEEGELRAVATHALEHLSTKTGQPPARLSHYLWLIGKDPEHRPWPRHHTQDTVYY